MEGIRKRVFELILLHLVISILSCQKPECYQTILEVERFNDNQILFDQLSIYLEIINEQQIIGSPRNTSIKIYKSNGDELQIIDGIVQYKNLYDYKVSCTLNLYRNANWISSCYVLEKKENLPQLILRVNEMSDGERQIFYYSSGKYKYIVRSYKINKSVLKQTSEEKAEY